MDVAIPCLNNFYKNLMNFEKLFKVEYKTYSSFNEIHFNFKNHGEKNEITHSFPDGDTRRFHSYDISITFSEKHASLYCYMFRYVKGRCFTEKEWLYVKNIYAENFENWIDDYKDEIALGRKVLKKHGFFDWITLKYMDHQIKFDDELLNAFKIMSKSKKHKLFRLSKKYQGDHECFDGEYDDYDDDLRWADTDELCDL